MATRLIGRGRSYDRGRNQRRFRVEGLEDRCLMSGVGSITEFPVLTSSSVPNGMTQGPDGNIWFTESALSASKIGVINPTTNAVSEFATPTRNSSPQFLTAGPDGNVWFTETVTQKIGMINLNTHAITEFSTGLTAMGPFDITTGPDGNLWFGGGASQIGEISPATHVVTLFTVPTAGAGPRGITVGPDGNLWFTENMVGNIGKFNLTTHAFTEYTIQVGSFPTKIVSGPDGNLWFTMTGGNAIGRISPTTGVITVFSTPTGGSAPSGLTSGPDGNLWFTERPAGQIASINPANGAIAEYPTGYSGSGPMQIMAGPDGNLWFSDGGSNAIGVATLATSQIIVTQQPPASVIAGSGFGVTVTAEDSSGNPITSFNGTVTVGLGSNPGGGTLGGTLTVTASNGVATFSGLTINKAASGYTLNVSANGFGLGVTSSITVTPAAASQLVITQQPASVSINKPFTVIAAVEDQFGNIVTTANNAVATAIANNPGGATLGGTTTVSAVNGIVTFSNLTLNKKGKGYTLRLSSAGLASATTSAFNV